MIINLDFGVEIGKDMTKIAIKMLLQDQIIRAIAVIAKRLNIESTCSPQSIPLKLLTTPGKITYQSAIAIKLSNQWQLNQIELAAALVAEISQRTPNPILPELIVTATPKGWIDLQLSDRDLAAWLQQWLAIPQEISDITQPSPIQINPFPIQYACARCCSLLRLGHQEGLMQLSDPDLKVLNWQVIAPSPIPWLSHHEPPNLILIHPQEQRLIASLLQTLDEFNSLTPAGCLQIATAFDGFHRYCRIWGEIKAIAPQLSQARLGLVAVTQTILKLLLQQRLNAFVPTEL